MRTAQTIILPLVASFLIPIFGCGGGSADFESQLAEAAKAAEKGKAAIKAEPATKGAKKAATGKMADDDTF